MAIGQQVQGIHHLQARIRIALIKEPELVLRTNHLEQIPAGSRVMHHHEVVPATGRVTRHREVVPAASRRGVTRRQSLRLQEALARDPLAQLAKAQQAKGNSR